MIVAPDLSDFSGPHDLSVEGIACAVPSITPGVYVLGDSSEVGEFVIKAVGRSDAHLRARLWSLVGDYPAFLCYRCQTPTEAYVLECELFHGLHIQGDGTHPCPPDGVEIHCPFCNES